MTSLLEEFGFIPPELLYKCDGFVKAFRIRPGSGEEFVFASIIFSAESPYLNELMSKIDFNVRATKFLMGLSVIFIIGTIFVSRWFAAGVVLVIIVAVHLYRVMEATITQQRSIILAVEMLASNFAGWGTIFPTARARAEPMFARDAGNRPKLIDLYFPLGRRSDPQTIAAFEPSEASRASAQSVA